METSLLPFGPSAETAEVRTGKHVHNRASGSTESNLNILALIRYQVVVLTVETISNTNI